jgi:hypothetical protein
MLIPKYKYKGHGGQPNEADAAAIVRLSDEHKVGAEAHAKARHDRPAEPRVHLSRVRELTETQKR